MRIDIYVSPGFDLKKLPCRASGGELATGAVGNVEVESRLNLEGVFPISRVRRLSVPRSIMIKNPVTVVNLFQLGKVRMYHLSIMFTAE